MWQSKFFYYYARAIFLSMSKIIPTEIIMIVAQTKKGKPSVPAILPERDEPTTTPSEKNA